MRAVRIHEFGGSDVLRLDDVPDPVAGPGEVLVMVRTAGINPGEIPIREGAWGGELPFGQGSDFAGEVLLVGSGVVGFRPGDDVIGMSDQRSAHAEQVAIAATRLVRKPPALDWDVAGCLYVVGTTARVAVDTVAPKPGETVVVAGAAGGVGVLAAQLAALAGARVIGTASADNHLPLRELGIVPVSHGDGLEERIRAAARDGVDAFIDTHGAGNVDLAIALGVDPSRIETIVDRAAAKKHGVNVVGMSSLIDPAPVVAELARQLAAGDLVLPIKARYAIDDVRTAYERLAERRGMGKIVLEVTTGA